VSGYWFCNPKVDGSGSTQMARMVTFADELGDKYGPHDFPLMMDVESYANESNGDYPALRGAAYENWLADGAGTLTRADAWRRRPIIYSNAAYFGAMGMQAGKLADCPLIVARYPFYFAGAPAPPADPDEWDDWILTATSKRPQVPTGWTDWDGWQFAAGFDRVGPFYGVSSADLDLNIIRPNAWAAWTEQAPVESHPDVTVPPLSPPAPNPDPSPAPTPTEDDMPAIVTNEDAFTDSSGQFGPAGAQYEPEFVKWEYVNGCKVHIGFEYWLGIGSPRGTPRPYAEIQAVPDVPEAPAAGAPVTLQVSGTFTGTAK
jgi:hypothetical protein